MYTCVCWYILKRAVKVGEKLVQQIRILEPKKGRSIDFLPFAHLQEHSRFSHLGKNCMSGDVPSRRVPWSIGFSKRGTGGFNKDLKSIGITSNVVVLYLETGSLNKLVFANVQNCFANWNWAKDWDGCLSTKINIVILMAVYQETGISTHSRPDRVPYKCIQDLHCKSYDEF